MSAVAGLASGQLGTLLRPIATPLVMSGFESDVSELFAGAFGSQGFVPSGGAGLSLGGVEIYEVGDQRVDLTAAMAKLADLGLRRVLVEGGGSLNFELLRLGLVDELSVFIAPLIFGGAASPTLADGAGDLRLNLKRAGVEAWDDGGLLVRYLVDRA